MQPVRNAQMYQKARTQSAQFTAMKDGQLTIRLNTSAPNQMTAALNV
jgi:hypothetical protein